METTWLLVAAFFGAAIGISMLFATGGGGSSQSRKSVSKEGKRKGAGAARPAGQEAWAQGYPGAPEPGATRQEHPAQGRPEIDFDPETPGYTGGAGSSTAMQPTVNRVCPIDGNRVDPAADKRELHGEIVGFCCDQCATAWDHLPGDEKRDKLLDVDDINE